MIFLSLDAHKLWINLILFAMHVTMISTFY